MHVIGGINCLPVACRTTRMLALLLAPTLVSRGENARPDFTGIWRAVSTTLGPLTKSTTEIRQDGSTLSWRLVAPGQPPMERKIYSTDGRVMTTKMGRRLIQRSGHWDGNRLVLEETGPGNAPWRRSTEQRILSLSTDGSRMIMKIHNLSDKRSIHDYSVQFERVTHLVWHLRCRNAFEIRVGKMSFPTSIWMTSIVIANYSF